MNVPAYQRLDVAALANVPAELTTGGRFVNWMELERDGKPTKVPVNPVTGYDAKSDTPTTWSTLDVAVAAYKRDPKLHGVGRMFVAIDGLVGIDFDHCLDEHCRVLPGSLAEKWLPLLNSYTEISPSRTGVKVWVKAVKHGNRCRNSKLGIEVYDSLRFFTLTGHKLDGYSSELAERQEIIDRLYKEIFPPIPVPSPSEPSLPSNLDDLDILHRARMATNGVRFETLWNGHFENNYGSQSEADAALCAILWFWAGDRETVRRLFGKSALGQRAKWQDRPDYQNSTLNFACHGDVYHPPAAVNNSNGNGTVVNHASEQPAPLPIVRRLNEFTKGTDNGGNVLGNRFLCRGGSLLFVGPTGVGKSSWELQAAIVWSLGREFFGIKPAKPIKSLIIQSENDDGDLSEMRDGVYQGLNLTQSEIATVDERVLVGCEDSRTGTDFVALVGQLVQQHKPDLLWIDPLFAYLGDSVVEQKAVSAFLRCGLNPILHDNNCALVLIHHSNKPTSGKEKADWKAGDLAYLGSGTGELANWSRAMVAIRSIGQNHVYELVFGKRGSRAGLKDKHGDTKYSQLIKYAEHGIYWVQADETDIETKKKWTAGDVREWIPQACAISQTDLSIIASENGLGRDKLKLFVTHLVENGTVHTWQIPRANARAAIAYSRSPQPTSGTSNSGSVITGELSPGKSRAGTTDLATVAVGYDRGAISIAPSDNRTAGCEITTSVVTGVITEGNEPPKTNPLFGDISEGDWTP